MKGNLENQLSPSFTFQNWYRDRTEMFGEQLVLFSWVNKRTETMRTGPCRDSWKIKRKSIQSSNHQKKGSQEVCCMCSQFMNLCCLRYQNSTVFNAPSKKHRWGNAETWNGSSSSKKRWHWYAGHKNSKILIQQMKWWPLATFVHQYTHRLSE